MASGFLGFMQGFAATDATIAEERAKKVDTIDVYVAERLAQQKIDQENKDMINTRVSNAATTNVDAASQDAQTMTNDAAGVSTGSPTNTTPVTSAASAGTAPVDPQGTIQTSTQAPAQPTGTPAPFQAAMANPSTDAANTQAPTAAPMAAAPAAKVNSLYPDAGAPATPAAAQTAPALPVPNAAPTSIPATTPTNITPYAQLDSPTKLKYIDLALGNLPPDRQQQYLLNPKGREQLGEEYYNKSQTAQTDNIAKTSETAAKNYDTGYDPKTNTFTPVWQRDKNTVLPALDPDGKGFKVDDSFVAPGALNTADRSAYEKQVAANQNFLKDAHVALNGETAQRAVDGYEKVINLLPTTSTGPLSGSVISQYVNKVLNDPAQSEFKAAVAQTKANTQRPGNRIFASELAPGGLLEQETASATNPETANGASLVQLVNLNDKIAQGSQMIGALSASFPLNTAKAEQSINAWSSANPKYVLGPQGQVEANKAYKPMTEWDFTTNAPKPEAAAKDAAAVNNAFTAVMTPEQKAYYDIKNSK